jgi:uncharacterized protein
MLFFNMFQRNNPTKQLFIELEELCDILIRSSEYLKKRCNSKETPAYTDYIHDQETKGDEVVKRVREIVLKSFILPMDKEDILSVTETLDSILDTLERVENRLTIYRLTSNEAVKDFSSLIVDSSHNIKIGFREISQNSYDSGIFITTCDNLNKLEAKGDKLHRKHLEKLMNDEKIKPNELLKWREVYQIMEDCLNLCEKLAMHFDEIRIKYI